MGSSKRKVVNIDAGGHMVYAGEGALSHLTELVKKLAPSKCFIIGDENTLRNCLGELLANVEPLRSAETIAVKSGEASKSLLICQDIWEHLAERTADRKALLINLGGGVVSDLGGFIAATYKRGIRSINVPTSLMGMVDAAIGGKTGIDLAETKNMVGVFHDPLAVYIHPPFLKTLSKREVLNGVAEMIKHGLVHDADHWAAVTKAPLHDLDALTALIIRSAQIKADIVKSDPQEKEKRKLLNFGHSIGHAIEAYSWESQHRVLLHGEAIAIGMICEAWLSCRFGSLSREEYEQITEHLIGLFKPYRLDGAADHRVIELMKNDKKNVNDQFNFTQLLAIGKAEVGVEVTAKHAREAMEHYRLLVRDAPETDDHEA